MLNGKAKKAWSAGESRQLATQACVAAIHSVLSDARAGKAVIDGPQNYMGSLYRSVPVAITVEGANILTRNLIVFGQGSVRAHPFLLSEMTAIGEADQKKGLADFDTSITGRKAFQAATRAHLPRFEIDTSDVQGRLKINPLIDWDAGQIEAYFIAHDLPRHPLIAAGYPSIGCSPCTSQVAPGEDPRSGRWKGWDKTECGIHKPGEEPFL